MFVEVGLCVKGGFVALGCGAVEVGLGGRVVVHPRLWRLCGGCWVIVVAGGGVLEAIAAECRARSR